jgi:hypothetical protein
LPPLLRHAPRETTERHVDTLLQGGRGRKVKKPDTFTFLAFTYFRARTRDGKIHIGRTPSINRASGFWARLPSGYGLTGTGASGSH